MQANKKSLESAHMEELAFLLQEVNKMIREIETMMAYLEEKKNKS